MCCRFCIGFFLSWNTCWKAVGIIFVLLYCWASPSLNYLLDCWWVRLNRPRELFFTGYNKTFYFCPQVKLSKWQQSVVWELVFFCFVFFFFYVLFFFWGGGYMMRQRMNKNLLGCANWVRQFLNFLCLSFSVWSSFFFFFFFFFFQITVLLTNFVYVIECLIYTRSTKFVLWN